MKRKDAAQNEEILERVESLGGGCVWEPEVFAVTLMDVAVDDGQAADLCGLKGVQQIAIDASRLSFETIQSLARIPGLASLVLANATLDARQLETLRSIGPDIVPVSE